VRADLSRETILTTTTTGATTINPAKRPPDGATILRFAASRSASRRVLTVVEVDPKTEREGALLI